jgi:hypothetical protein
LEQCVVAPQVIQVWFCAPEQVDSPNWTKPGGQAGVNAWCVHAGIVKEVVEKLRVNFEAM